MTDTAPNDPSNQPNAPAKGGGRIWLVLFIIAALGVVGGKLYWPVVAPQVMSALGPVIDTVRGQSKPTGDVRKPTVKQTAPAPALIVSTPAPVVSTPTPAPVVSAPVRVAPEPAPVVSSPVPTDSEAIGNGVRVDEPGELESLRAAVTVLGMRIQQLEAQQQAAAQSSPATNTRYTALALAVTGLSRPLSVGSPFRRTLDAVALLGADDEIVSRAAAALSPYADGGVPTLATLQQAFPATARAVMRARAQGESTGLMGEIKNKLGGLVSVRRTATESTSGGDDVEVALARTEAALAAGKLESAAGALAKLSGPPGKAAQGWLEGATARLEAEGAMDALHGRALSLLADGG